MKRACPGSSMQLKGSREGRKGMLYEASKADRK